MKTFKITYLGQQTNNDWKCFAWNIQINGEKIEYFTGLGHCTKSTSYLGTKPLSIKHKKTIKATDKNGDVIYVHVPKMRDILYSLALDAQCSNDIFEDFCSNLGYDTDSRKALEIYLECQEANLKLRKIFKSNNVIERITAWEL